MRRIANDGSRDLHKNQLLIRAIQFQHTSNCSYFGYGASSSNRARQLRLVCKCLTRFAWDLIAAREQDCSISVRQCSRIKYGYALRERPRHTPPVVECNAQQSTYL